MRAVIRRYSVCTVTSRSSSRLQHPALAAWAQKSTRPGGGNSDGEGETRNKWFSCGYSNSQPKPHRSLPASPTSTSSRFPLVAVGTPDFSKRRRLFVCNEQRWQQPMQETQEHGTGTEVYRGTRGPRGSITPCGCLASVVQHHLIMCRPAAAAQVSRRSRDALALLVCVDRA